MLTPDYLDSVADEIIDLYADLEDGIIRDIARSIVKAGEVTSSAGWQAVRLQHMGLLYDDIIRLVSEITDASSAQIRTIFEDAGVTSVDADNAIYRSAGLDVIPIKLMPDAMQALEAGLRKTSGHLANLTMTTAAQGQQTFIRAITLAEMQIESGAYGYSAAIRNAIKKASSDGAWVQFPSGHRDRVDVAARRAILTGVNQTVATISLSHALMMGSDLVETTAHAGARPSHVTWQGRVFSLSGRSAKYPEFTSGTGYGTGEGLCGYNCRHSFYPYFDGLSAPAYSAAKLDEYSQKSVSYNGDILTYYEATQVQRGMERKIRETKRELVGLDAAIEAADDDSLRGDLKGDYNKTASDLKTLERRLKDFLRQAGLQKDSSRTQAAGFGHSQAQKAVWAARRVQTGRENAIIISEIKKEAGIRGAVELNPTIPDVKMLSFDDEHITARGHSVTLDQAREYIASAKIKITRWNGKYENYYSDSGAAFVDAAESKIRTAFSALEYDEKTRKMMEVLRRYAK